MTTQCPKCDAENPDTQSFCGDCGIQLIESEAQEVAFTKTLNEILAEVDQYKKAVPLPVKAYDNVIATTAPLALSKETRTADIFERYRDELKERVENRIGVVEDEKLRLMWMGLPPLCDFKLLDYLEKHGAVVVKSMLEYLTGFTLDPDLMIPENPLESLARAQLLSPANPFTQSSVDYFVKAAKEYRIDGLISVVKRSCSRFSRAKACITRIPERLSCSLALMSPSRARTLR